MRFYFSLNIHLAFSIYPFIAFIIIRSVFLVCLAKCTHNFFQQTESKTEKTTKTTKKTNKIRKCRNAFSKQDKFGEKILRCISIQLNSYITCNNVFELANRSNVHLNLNVCIKIKITTINKMKSENQKKNLLKSFF